MVGFDPRLHTAAMIEDLAKACSPRASSSRRWRANPVDRVWGRERPAPPQGAVIPHAMKYAGKAAEQKIAELQAALRKEGEDAVILTLPDSIAWLFNIRGCGRRAQPRGAGVRHRAGERQAGAVRRSGQDRAGGQGASGAARQDQRAGGPRASAGGARRARASASGSIRPRPRAGSSASSSGGKARIVRGPDPCLLPKARKNAAEIKGARAAHKRDGAAVVRFLAWLDREALGRRARRDRRSRAARDDPQRDAGAEGDQLRHHLGRGPERRHRPLPRDHRHQPQARLRRALSRRLRRPVPRRHHRHHAHRRHRQADARDARALHAAC